MINDNRGIKYYLLLLLQSRSRFNVGRRDEKTILLTLNYSTRFIQSLYLNELQTWCGAFNISSFPEWNAHINHHYSIVRAANESLCGTTKWFFDSSTHRTSIWFRHSNCSNTVINYRRTKLVHFRNFTRIQRRQCDGFGAATSQFNSPQCLDSTRYPQRNLLSMFSLQFFRAGTKN